MKSLFLCLGFLLEVAVLATFLQPAVAENCTWSEDTCSCNTSQGLIDLTPLSRTDGVPMFTGLVDPDNFVYSYNPCHKFDEGDCTNAYICQADPDSTQEHVIADTKEKLHGFNNGTFVLTYKSVNNVVVEGVKVDLICDQDLSAEKSEVIALGDGEDLQHYRFSLRSCQVCVGGCQSHHESTSALAGIIGLVLMIVFVLGVIVYFVAGAIIMKVRYDATGSDLIPNKSFWAALPFLVKDGCLFVVSPCCKNKDGYSNL